MTVGQLIERLQDLDPALRVFVTAYEYGIDEVDGAGQVEIAGPFADAPWHGGMYGVEDEEWRDRKSGPFNGVYIGSRRRDSAGVTNH